MPTATARKKRTKTPTQRQQRKQLEAFQTRHENRLTAERAQRTIGAEPDSSRVELIESGTPDDGYFTKAELASWTVVELRTFAVDCGLKVTGLRKPDLIAELLTDQENDYYSEDQLNRMPKPVLSAVARAFGIAVGRRSRPSIVTAILHLQAVEGAAV
jgi:hypothetical protein